MLDNTDGGLNEARKYNSLYCSELYWECLRTAPALQVIRSPEAAFEQKQKAILEFADGICGKQSLDIRSSDTQLDADVNFKINSFLSKLANLGFSIGGKYIQNVQFNVLQKDLLEAIKIGTDCKRKIWDDLKYSVLEVTPPPACDLKGKRLMIHYSEILAADYLGAAVPALRYAGAASIDSYLKPKSEVGMPQFFRVFTWGGRDPAVAAEVKKCLETSAYFSGKVQVSGETGRMIPEWAAYDAIVYLVNQ